MSAALAHREPYDEYIEFCEGIHRLSGIDLLQYKRGQMERRLRTLAERRGFGPLADYLAVLGRDAEELDRFLDRVTINVSQLWRNPEQWAMLGRHVVPELAAAGRIRVWSAGCSYGAECLHGRRGLPRERAPGAARGPRHRHRPAHDRTRPGRRLLRRGRAHGSRRLPRALVRAHRRRRREGERQAALARSASTGTTC